MDLIHFSAAPILRVTASTQADEPTMKPRGFWVSDEATEWGWQAWCQAEDFALDRLQYRTRVHLRPDHRVLVLSSTADIRRLTDDYGGAPKALLDLDWSFRQGYGIDWRLVARDYQGIIITPYQWKMRLNPHCLWYYGWDCASGCLWDPSAIARLDALGATGLPVRVAEAPGR